MRDGCDGHSLHGGGYERFNESGFTARATKQVLYPPPARAPS